MNRKQLAEEIKKLWWIRRIKTYNEIAKELGISFEDYVGIVSSIWWRGFRDYAIIDAEDKGEYFLVWIALPLIVIKGAENAGSRSGNNGHSQNSEVQKEN